jgi:hypothetical protein
MPTIRNPNPPRRPEDSPVAWFVVLEDARNRGDAAAEERATQELQRLGVAVTYRPATPTGGEA